MTSTAQSINSNTSTATSVTNWTMSQVRQTFIEFFQNKQHQHIPGSSVVPHKDPALLFIIAGMAQFKNVFLGLETKPANRATNSQNCIRVVDLEDVGNDARHLTNFEMLGSWSFGDYYKTEAIAWAYELLFTVFQFPTDKIWVTIHHTDPESGELWVQQGIDPSRVVVLGDADNFWSMGPVGPCGPCSEIYYDQGETVGQCFEQGKTCVGPGCSCDRFLEFWNLVFMQFNRQTDGSLEPLAQNSVDTGAGLERLTSLLQNIPTVFGIDAFQNMFQIFAQRFGVQNPPQFFDDSFALYKPFCIIADHIRMLLVCLNDGVYFSNEGRGYVLRRVLRRACRQMLSIYKALGRPFNPLEYKANMVVGLADIVHFCIQGNGIAECFEHIFGAYSDNDGESINSLVESIRAEENKFYVSYIKGENLLLAQIDTLKQTGVNPAILSGKEAFLLHDRWGFALELTQLVCAEHGVCVDTAGFDLAMTEQQETAKKNMAFSSRTATHIPWVWLDPAATNIETVFDRQAAEQFATSIVSYYIETETQTLHIMPAATNIYTESGGQVSDSAWVLYQGHKLHVTDIYTHNNKQVLAIPSGPIRYADFTLHPTDTVEYKQAWYNLQDMLASEHTNQTRDITLCIDSQIRAQVASHHSATHLLHQALCTVLGSGIQQAGSFVGPDKLRFDFTHGKALTEDQLQQVETQVQDAIRQRLPVNTTVCSVEEAKKTGAKAMFDEKYGTTVRVVSMGNSNSEMASIEFCGGTHVTNTQDILCFKILGQMAVNSGVRRIEAVAGQKALEILQQHYNTLDKIAKENKIPLDQVEAFVDSTKKKVLHLETSKQDLWASVSCLYSKSIAPSLVSNMEPICILEIHANLHLDTCAKELAYQIHKPVVVFQKNTTGYQVAVAITETQLSVSPYKAHDLLKSLNTAFQGRGGGKPNFAKGSLAVDSVSVTEIYNKLIPYT
jgi:alanyl-tRNA synthetase